MLSIYFQLGFHHLTEAGAWDHQLFLATIALAYAPDLWRRWILLATLFAIGHTLSIVGMSMDIIPEGLPWVEPAILGSLVVMALVEVFALRQNPFSIGRSWTLPVLAGCFGLVHGLGFGASFLSVLAPGASVGELASALLAFTLGVEAAQLLLLFGMWVLAFALFSLLQWRTILLRQLLLIGIALIACVKLIDEYGPAL